jgi:hypothetical protein
VLSRSPPWGAAAIIHLVDRALERFFRLAPPLDESTVDVSFDAPEKTWGAGLTRPTLNIFLWQVVKSTAKTRAGLGERDGADGRVERRPVPPMIQLNYVVTAWATDQRDEHQLLGTALEWVLAHDQLPPEVLPEPLDGLPCELALSDLDTPTDLWSALEGRVKPGLQIQLTLPVEIVGWREAAKPVDTITTRTERGSATPPPPADETRPPLRRRRAHGALVMEGRPEPESD